MNVSHDSDRICEFYNIRLIAYIYGKVQVIFLHYLIKALKRLYSMIAHYVS